MAKLILKQQEPPKSSWLNQYGSQVAYARFIALLLIISLGIFFAFKPNVAVQAQPKLDSATNVSVKAQYLSDWQKLNEMELSYEQLAKTVDSYDQALVLLNQAEMAWQHLLIMTELADTLSLSANDKKQLAVEQAYLQDQWQARIHFSELRLERFGDPVQQVADTPPDSVQLISSATNAVNVPTTTEFPHAQAVADGQPSNKYITQPPAGVELPAGFCTLNSAGVCKPETSN